MAGYSELDALNDVHEALTKLADDAARARVLRWAGDKFGVAVEAQGPSQPPSTSGGSGDRRSGAKRASARKSGARKGRNRAKKKAKMASSQPSIAKDLDLRPEGKEFFGDFAARLSPSTYQEKCTVAVYYLKKVIGRDPVGVNEVYTCFKRASWRIPSNLRNTMQTAASRKGWLDTAEMEDVIVTPAGENLVEHDLQAEN